MPLSLEELELPGDTNYMFVFVYIMPQLACTQYSVSNSLITSTEYNIFFVVLGMVQQNIHKSFFPSLSNSDLFLKVYQSIISP